MRFADQSEFSIRCEWGAQGIGLLAPLSDVVIIVDVLSFCTSVEIATTRGAIIFPYPFRGENARAFAESANAELADRREPDARYSLSPQSLLEIPRGTRLVLPSPNGATLTLATGTIPTLAGCLRNARAVAKAAKKFGERIAVIPAGERWQDGSIRFVLEDWIGAGAILNELEGAFSPEASAAQQTFRALKSEPDILARCSSGKELIGKGFPRDVELASAYNVSETVPIFRQGAYAAL